MLTYNGVHVKLLVLHVTCPNNESNLKGVEYVATCDTITDIQNLINSPRHIPKEGWMWELNYCEEFHD